MPMHSRDSSFLVLLLALAPACGFFGLDGDDVVASVACVDGSPSLEALVPQETVVGRLSVEDPDTQSSTCGGAGNPDHAYRLLPTISGTYDVWVQSEFDAVLYVVAEPCEDPSVVECVDSGVAGSNELLSVELEANVPYVVVVDAFTASIGGSFSLLVTFVGAGGEGCAGVQQTLETSLGVDRFTGAGSGTTIGRTDPFSSSCGAASGASSGADDAWRFVPPTPGVYRFSLTSSETPGTLSVRDASCSEIACSDVAASSWTLEVMLSTDPYDIVVSGAGAYDLFVEQVLDAEISTSCLQPCTTAAECSADERCLDTTDGQLCLASLCETCFAQGLTCHSLAYTCGGLACS